MKNAGVIKKESVNVKQEQLIPQIRESFQTFSKYVFTDGAIPSKTKQLIAVAVAHVTQCSACIQGHTELALKKGASMDEVLEAIWVAVEMRAGASLSHSSIAINTMKKLLENKVS